MLEGIQQTYPGVGAFAPPTVPQPGLNSPLGGMMGSGLPGLFGNAGLGRPVDPFTQAYLQQTQIPQGIFGNPQQWNGPIGRPPIDPFTLAYLQQIVQTQIAQILGPQALFGSPRHSFIDPMTLALLQQTQMTHPFPPQTGYGSQPFGGSPFGRVPYQNPVGAGAYGPLTGW